MQDPNARPERRLLPTPITAARSTALVPVPAVTPSTLLAELRRAEAPADDEIKIGRAACREGV